MNDVPNSSEALALDSTAPAADPSAPASDQPGLAADPSGAAGGRADDGPDLTLPADGPASGQASQAAGAAGAAGPIDGTDAVALFGRAEALVREVRPGGRTLGELRAAAGAAKRLQGGLDAAMCDITTEIAALTTPGRAAGVISEQTGKSKRDASRLAKVAQGLAAMPNTKKRLAEGGFTIDHAAALVNTAQTAGASAVDNDEALLGLAESKPADVFAGDAKRAELKASRDRGEAELKRQRNARKASLGKDRDSGMGILHAELDPISHGLLAQALQTHADRLWRTDSKAGNTAARTGPQRMADALLETITGLDALTHKPLPANGNGKGSSGRPQLIITADIGLFDGANPDGACEMLGTGPVPPAILGRLSADTAVAGMIFAGDGRALWLGTSTRTPNAAQRLAIAVRDKGCVRCGAPIHMADIHHIVEWENGGPTDIDNLQALCGPCHRQHHHDQDQKAGRQPRRRKPPKRNGKNRKNNGTTGGTQGLLAMNSSGIQHRIPVSQIPSLTGANRSPGADRRRAGRSPASETRSRERWTGSRQGPTSPSPDRRAGPGTTRTIRNSGTDPNPACAAGNRDDRACSSAASGKTPAAATRSRDGPDP